MQLSQLLMVALFAAVPQFDIPEPGSVFPALPEMEAPAPHEPAGPAWSREADPFRRVALKARAGMFEGAPAWKLAAYERGLAQGATTSKRLLLTAYLGTEWDGKRDRYGNHCTLRHVAANRLPRKSYVWTRYGLRQVLDCGAKSNDRKADRRGCDAWADYWYPTARDARRAGLDGWTPARAAVIK